MTEAPRHPLRDVLAGTDASAPVDWLKGVVSAVQTTTEPHTIRVLLADGTETGELTFLGWYSPTVDDVVHMLRKGPALFVLGPEAPANVFEPPAPVVPPPPPPPPPQPPRVRTVSITPTDAAYWSPWGWRRDELIQGGPRDLRTFWFYGSAIAAAKGAGVITAASIYMRRRTTQHGVNGRANVRLGTHPFPSAPSSGAAALSNVSVQARVARGKGVNVPLSSSQIASLNAGADGIGLEPGSDSYSSPDYLIVDAGGASGQLSLTIQT